jgi:polysaccharide chain length determinant protein (PEP-CTERM system associated)
MEALVTSLQSRIRVSGGRDNIFTIQYEDADRDKAREVVAAVLDAFVERSIGNEGTDSEVTERAVASEIEVHEQRLRDAEQRLARFKQDNLGYMPGEYGDYYNRLEVALANVGATREKIRLVAQRRDELNRQIEGEEPTFGIMPSAISQCASAPHLQQLQTQLAALLVEFTDKHPRVVTLQETVARLRQECASETPSDLLPGSVGSPSSALEMNPVYQNLRLQLTNAEVELVELQAQLDAQEGAVTRLRRDVDRLTEVETQLKQLNRDYGIVQARHQELVSRWEDLQAKKRLDPVTDRVQFRRIEPPFAPAEPVGPDRPLMLAAVLVFALSIGGGAAFALNQLRPVFFTTESLRRSSSFPVLGSIRMVLTAREKSRRRLEAIYWGGACMMLLALGGLAVLLASEGTLLFRNLTRGFGS